MHERKSFRAATKIVFWSLILLLAILAGGVLFSLWKTRDEPDIGAEQVPETGRLEP